MEWKDIKHFNKNFPPLNQMYRHPKVQEKYDTEIKNEKELEKILFKRAELWVMTKNNYPYHFIDDTKHYVIWFRKKINYKLVEFLLRDYKDVVYFENYKNNKSIKSIPHIHVFIKKIIKVLQKI